MDEKPHPDPPLTTEEKEIVGRLDESDLLDIDELLMANASNHWRKVAMIAGLTMMYIKKRDGGEKVSGYSRYILCATSPKACKRG